jgi:hypothetical protein
VGSVNGHDGTSGGFFCEILNGFGKESSNGSWIASGVEDGSGF